MKQCCLHFFFCLRSSNAYRREFSRNFISALSHVDRDTRSLNFFNYDAIFESRGHSTIVIFAVAARKITQPRNDGTFSLHVWFYRSQRHRTKQWLKLSRTFRQPTSERMQKRAHLFSLTININCCIPPNLITAVGCRYPSSWNYCRLKRGVPTDFRNLFEGLGRREYRHDNHWFVLILAGVCERTERDSEKGRERGLWLYALSVRVSMHAYCVCVRAWQWGGMTGRGLEGG